MLRNLVRTLAKCIVFVVVVASLVHTGLTFLPKHVSLPVYKLNPSGIVINDYPPAQDQCEAAQQAAAKQCSESLENRWYDGGAIYYDRKNNHTDVPICRLIGDAAFQACKHYGEPNE